MDETQQALLILQDVLTLAARLSAERDVYRQLIIVQPDLKQAADDYFASAAYADKLAKYNSLRNLALDALHQKNLEEFADSLGRLAGELNQNRNPPVNKDGLT